MTARSRRALALACAALALGAAGPPLAAAQGLTLERAVALAVERDERARVADQELAAAEAQVGRARAFFFPDITASGSYRFRRDPGMFQDRNVLSGSLALNMALFDGRGIPLLRAARLERDASELDRLEVRRRLAIDAASAYLATLGTQAVVEAARNRVEFARQNLEDVRGRVAAQLVSSNDATRAQLELSTAQRELRGAEGDLAAARLHLGWLIGAEIDGPLAEPDALLAAAAGDRGAPAGRAADARLDLRAARTRVASAYEVAEEPLWRWLPSVSLVAQVDATSVASFTGKQTDWFVGLNALWTLWDGGAREADRAERLAHARAASLTADRQEREVGLEEATARSALATAQATSAEAEAAVAAARKNVEEARILYQQGLARALEVADASARLFEAEVALARERYGLGLALIELRAARGLGPLGDAPGSER